MASERGPATLEAQAERGQCRRTKTTDGFATPGSRDPGCSEQHVMESAAGLAWVIIIKNCNASGFKKGCRLLFYKCHPNVCKTPPPLEHDMGHDAFRGQRTKAATRNRSASESSRDDEKKNLGSLFQVGVKKYQTRMRQCNFSGAQLNV